MSNCRRCSECLGQRHHWCTEMLTDDGRHLQCKHCDAIASECGECAGEGCDECSGGVVEILDCVEMADRVLALDDRRGIEWDPLVEELRDEVVRLRLALPVIDQARNVSPRICGAAGVLDKKLKEYDRALAALSATTEAKDTK
jgi:hypothetical protein